MPHATSVCETVCDFVALHKLQLQGSGIPERYWPTLFKKLKDEIFDAGQSFQMLRVEEVFEEEEEEEETVFSWQVVVTKKGGIKIMDLDQVYLIDHAWTYQVKNAQKELESIPGLLERMVSLMDIPTQDRSKEELIQDVLRDMWQFNQTYKIGINDQMGANTSSPFWYVMDEFGSRVQHGDSPSVRMVPFFYIPTKLAFTIMWPLKDLRKGDEVTRNFIEGDSLDSLMKKVKLLPWQPEDMSHLSFEQHEADENFFMKFKGHESFSDLDVKSLSLPRDRNLLVYTDVNVIRDNLTDCPFELVQDQESADIWWTKQHIQDFREFSESYPGSYVNQFPYEMVLTIKDLLGMVARRAAKGYVDHNSLERGPSWLQATYNLNTELAKFVSYFQHREAAGLDNYWICQPGNPTLGFDTHITNNLSYILRLTESGPKIASKYVEDPVLFEVEDVGSVKFDMRFTVMVHSIQPLTITVHRKFLVCLATQPFSLGPFDVTEKHLTRLVNNDGTRIEIPCDEFVCMFEAQNPGFCWEDTENDIYCVLRELFEAATSTSPPKAIAHSPQSRAMYGVDIILKWTNKDNGEKIIQPVLQGVTRDLDLDPSQDLERLVDLYPNFINDVFSVLFLEDYEGREVNIL